MEAGYVNLQREADLAVAAAVGKKRWSIFDRYCSLAGEMRAYQPAFGQERAVRRRDMKIEPDRRVFATAFFVTE